MNKIVACLVVALTLVGFAANAQYDDIYYNPDVQRSAPRYDSRTTTRQNQEYSTEYGDEDSYAYTDEYDDEAYDYYYTSRIRRFHRPLYGFGYYDPFYTDMYYYDPFMSPAVTMLIYDTPYGFGSWYRWNRLNRWALRNSWRSGMAWGYDPFYSSFGGPSIMVNNYYGRPGWAWNSWNTWNSYSAWGGGWGPYSYAGGGYYGSGLYCPPSWGYGYNYNTPNEVANNVHYGPRGAAGATSVAPRTNLPRSRETTVEPRSTDRYTNPATSRNGDPRTATPSDRYTREGVDRSSVPDRYSRPEATPRTNDRNSDEGFRTAPADRYSRDRIDRSAAPDRARTYEPDRTTSPRAITPRSDASPRSYSPPRTMTPRSSGSDFNRSAPRQEPRSYSPSSREFQSPRSFEPRSSSPGIERSSPSPSRSGSIDRSSVPSRSSGSSSSPRSRG